MHSSHVGPIADQREFHRISGLGGFTASNLLRNSNFLTSRRGSGIAIDAGRAEPPRKIRLPTRATFAPWLDVLQAQASKPRYRENDATRWALAVLPGPFSPDL